MKTITLRFIIYIFYPSLKRGIAYCLLILVVSIASCQFAPKPTNHTAHFDSVIDAANPLLRSGKIQQAFTFVDSAYSIIPNASHYDLAKKYGWKGAVLANMNDYKQAIVYIDSDISELSYNQDEYKLAYGGALLAKGQALVKLNDFTQAYECYYKGKLIIQKQKDTCEFARYNAALGTLLFTQHKYKEAVGYFREEYQQSAKCAADKNLRSFAQQQSALDDMGLCYERMEQYDSAEHYYLLALNYIDENNKKNIFPEEFIRECKSVIKGNLGGVYLHRKKFAEAETLFKENIANNYKEGYDNIDGQLTIIKLAQLYIDEGRYNDAASRIYYMRTVLDKRPYIEGEMRWRKLAWHYYDAVNKPKEAYAHYKSYVQLTDSIELATRELPGSDFNKTFDHLNQKDQIIALEKEKGNATKFLFVFLAVSIMAVVIIYLVWENYQQSKANLLRQTKLNKQISTHNGTMQKTLNALEQSQQNNTRMMRVVAHDLHNPVSAMVSLIDLLRDGDFDEEQDEMFEMLATSGTNALKLIGDVLHTKPAMEMERLKLDELVTYSVGLMQYRANDKKQTLLLKVEPVSVLADREKIWRVINNLIVNAIKFSYESKTIEISLSRQGNVALLKVKDEGVGMSSILQGQIFQNFAIGGKEGTAGEESFGLGLSICKQIIDAHGGKIWFESAPGKGTTFFVELRFISDVEN